MSKKTPSKIDSDIGFRIRQARQRKRLSQKDLAGAVDVSFQQFQKYEQGVNKIPPGRLYTIAQILELEPNDLFGFTAQQEATLVGAEDAASIDRRAYDLWNKIGNVHSKRVVLALMDMLKT